MDEAAKLKRDIETLRDSMRQNWLDLAQLSLTANERDSIMHHAKWCAQELNMLVLQLEHLAPE